MRAADSYAQALFGAVESAGDLRAAADELDALRGLYLECGRYLNDPLIGAEEKGGLLRDLLTDQVQPLTLEFLLFLLRRRHLAYLPAAADRFRYLCDGYFGIATVLLRLPCELEPEVLARLKLELADLGLIPGAEKAEYRIKLDKDIIGGFIADCNGMQIDASLRTALAKLNRMERYGTQ